MDRRSFVNGVAGAVAGSSLLWPRSLLGMGLPEGTLQSEERYALPDKQPLIKRSFRPPNFETPVDQFTDVLTPNDRFFVRWHLASIPEIEAGAWRLRVANADAASAPLELTLEQLKRDYEQVEIVAVCQCSGNRRGLSDPHVPGVQWGYGAMGNARWKGVRLRDLLAKAGVGTDAVEVAFDGADRGALDATPDFVKSIPIWKAMDENTLVAWEMNGSPLPHWNGAPARLIVPGWTSPYWG
jgi:DMSO/TMAO reductase YedYZ molybdopterin-dependent catalytic subunit